MSTKTQNQVQCNLILETQNTVLTASDANTDKKFTAPRKNCVTFSINEYSMMSHCQGNSKIGV